MSERRVRVTIRGRVQGVGFRMFVADEARSRGLGGWVRNRRDGAVEAMFAGAPEIVEETLAACRRGPPGARVDSVEIAEAHAPAPQDVKRGFAILPTV
jgi:acylphosphatase